MCLSVLLGTLVSCAKTAEPNEKPFGADCWVVGPRKHVLDGVHIHLREVVLLRRWHVAGQWVMVTYVCISH